MAIVRESLNNAKKKPQAKIVIGKPFKYKKKKQKNKRLTFEEIKNL